MHDPMTQIRSVPNPFLRKRHGYRPPLITIWHVDPETDGSDDSCGWFEPKLTKDQKQRIGWLVDNELKFPWFTAYRGKELPDPVVSERLAIGLYLKIAGALRVDVTIAEAQEWALHSVHGKGIRSKLCYLPGWHSNSDTEWARKEHVTDVFFKMGRTILRRHRPWYRHPRWHVHHWQIQIHPLQHFKRWAFSRCTKCGERFRWGEFPVGPWSGDGPQWFKPEPGVYHVRCDGGPSEAKAA